MSKDISESAKVAIAIKTARTALSLSQLEFSDRLGISKTTLARIETLESEMSLSFYMKAIKLINDLGVTVDAMVGDDIVITIKPQAQLMVVQALADENNRRSDRKTGLLNVANHKNFGEVESE